MTIIWIAAIALVAVALWKIALSNIIIGWRLKRVFKELLDLLQQFYEYLLENDEAERDKELVSAYRQEIDKCDNKAHDLGEKLRGRFPAACKDLIKEISMVGGKIEALGFPLYDDEAVVEPAPEEPESDEPGPDEPDELEAARKTRILKIVGIVLLAAALIGVGIWLFSSLNKSNANPSESSAASSSMDDEMVTVWYNDYVKNANYGPEVEGKTAEEVAQVMSERASKDPAFLASTIVAAEEAKGSQLVDGGDTSTRGNRINSLIKLFLEDKSKRKKAISVAEDYLKNSRKELVENYSYNGEQTWQEDDPNTVKRVVAGGNVEETTRALVYTDEETGRQAAFRMACGGQWILPVEQFNAPPIAVPVTPTTPSSPDTPELPRKYPEQDPVNQGNAQVGGGKNLPTDGAGEYQPSEPVWQPGTIITKPESQQGGGSSSQQSNPGPDRDYGGTKDPTAGDPSAGKVDNGTPPPTNPIPVDKGTEVIDTKTKQKTKVADEPVNSGTIAEPPI